MWVAGRTAAKIKLWKSFVCCNNVSFSWGFWAKLWAMLVESMPRHQKKAVLASSALTKRWANRENLFSTLSTANTATQTETAEKNHTERKSKQRAMWTSEQRSKLRLSPQISISNWPTYLSASVWVTSMKVWPIDEKFIQSRCNKYWLETAMIWGRQFFLKSISCIYSSF